VQRKLTKREKIKKFNEEIKEANKVRDGFLVTLREEDDKDYREGLILNVERCDQIIRELGCKRDAL
jgi:hypothetical protein